MSERITAFPWQLPVPSTSLLREPILEPVRPGWSLTWEYEADSEFAKSPRAGNIRQRMLFEGVVALKYSLSYLCGADMIKLAYDTLVDLGQTEWVGSMQTQSDWLRKELSLDEVRHVAIYFDQRPCYEFVCRAVSISEEFLPR